MRQARNCCLAMTLTRLPVLTVACFQSFMILSSVWSNIQAVIPFVQSQPVSRIHKATLTTFGCCVIEASDASILHKCRASKKSGGPLARLYPTEAKNSVPNLVTELDRQQTGGPGACTAQLMYFGAPDSRQNAGLQPDYLRGR